MHATGSKVKTGAQALHNEQRRWIMTNTVEDNSHFEHLDGSTVAYLQELRQMDPDIIDDLVGLFLHNADQAIQNIDSCIRNGSLADAKHYLHKLKGSSLALGAQGIAKICEALENKVGRWTQGVALDSEANELLEDLRNTGSQTFLEIKKLKSTDAA
jgi:HPt (histidine-containing phosphotransfer) domain-containing protein